MDETGLIRDYFQGRPDVAAVYLYGSVAEGQTTSFSDVDIGVLYEREQLPSFDQHLDDTIRLSEQLQTDVDLANLNTASPILSMQVLKKGRLILNQNGKAVHYFFINTLNEYFDLKQSRLNLQRAIQAAIDLAAHVVASEGLGVPASMKEHFMLLDQAKILHPTLTRKMLAMVGFRNTAVHHYS